VTLDEVNLTWLRGRARVTSNGNVSSALDTLITQARTGGTSGKPVRSAVGLVAIPADDPDLSKAKAAVRALFAESLSRPLFVREDSAPSAARGSRTSRPRARTRRG
jgi:hypothetical protein